MAFSTKAHHVVLEIDAGAIITNLDLIGTNILQAEAIVKEHSSPLGAYFLAETKEILKTTRVTKGFLSNFLDAHSESPRSKRSGG